MSNSAHIFSESNENHFNNNFSKIDCKLVNVNDIKLILKHCHNKFYLI